MLGLLSACGNPANPTSPTTASPLAKELVFYDWPDDMPQSVLDAFTAEYGVKVTYQTFESQEEAIANIQAGQKYDLAVIENDFIPSLVAEGRLAEIDFRHVPNFKNISANFRDLVFDPGNEHTVPYHWGTTGLIVRTDLAPFSITRWSDLWDPRLAGKIALRPQQRELVALTLRSLGYSLNSEDPQELEAVLKRLVMLKKSVFFVDVSTASAVPRLLSGEAVVLVGWAEDAQAARAENEAVAYILPQEGTGLWNDYYVIAADSPNKSTAELFLNFLLRPEISAQIVNEKYYANANEAAQAFIQPEILNDPAIYPPKQDIEKADFYLPLSPAGEKLYDDIWSRFMAEGQ